VPVLAAVEVAVAVQVVVAVEVVVAVGVAVAVEVAVAVRSYHPSGMKNSPGGSSLLILSKSMLLRFSSSGSTGSKSDSRASRHGQGYW